MPFCWFALLAALVSLQPCLSEKLYRQCSCQEYQRCKSAVLSALMPCAEQCQSHIVTAGANFGMLRECARQRHEQIEATIDCLERSFPYGCTNEEPEMVPRISKIAMELAFVTEGSKMAKAANLHGELGPFIKLGRKYAKCVQKCVGRLTNKCAEQKECALDLPPAEEFVDTAKQCAITSGFLSKPVLKQLCECAVNAGLRKLHNSCPAIDFIHLLK